MCFNQPRGTQLKMEPEISPVEKILISLVILFCGVANIVIKGRYKGQGSSDKG